MSDSRKITLYIVRHGECLGNLAQKFTEPSLDVLTDVGKAQAELLGAHLKDIRFTRVYASDYPRTHDTCRGILKQSEQCSSQEIKLEPRIRERNYTGLIGVSAGKGMDLLTSSIQAGTPYLKVEMPGSETVDQFESRIISFFTELLQSLKNGNGREQEETILIVSHGMTIQRLMVLLNNRHGDLGLHSWKRNLFAEKLMRNTSYHKLILSMDGGQISGHVEEAHCREHVDGTKDEKTKDCGNYSYMEENKTEDQSTEQEKAHYCIPA